MKSSVKRGCGALFPAPSPIRADEESVFAVLDGPQQFEKNPNASGIMRVGEL